MDLSERRKAERVRVELPATIDGSAWVVVRDLSEEGAGLEGADLATLPEDFDLTITQPSGEIKKRRARLVWRKEGKVGVRFSDTIGA